MSPYFIELIPQFRFLMTIPISILFVGLNGLIAFALSYIVVMERTKTRIWHGETETEVSHQPNYLERPNIWAAFVESYTQKSVITKTADDGILQRKVRAYGNFTEYVPLGLLFVITLELMHSSSWVLWLLGSALTIGRVAHAWGLITTYGPSPGRAVGFFLTGFVYIVGASACVYYGVAGLLS
jgi:uncharacterized membrane protein YecN with MAPEG domain